MISKVCSGHSFSGSIRYVCQASKKADILLSEGVRDYDPKLMIKDFQTQQAFRPEKKQACFHGILSFYPGEKPSDQIIREIAKKYLTGLGIIDTQFAVVKHTDRDHLHVHLIANLVNNKGLSIPDKWIGLRGKKLAQQLTMAYSLKQGVGKKLPKIAFKNLGAPDQYKYRIYVAIKQELRQSRSLEQLGSRLAKLGIQMEYKYKGKTNEKQGVSFHLGDYCFKGSEIDRHYSYWGLRNEIEYQLSLLDQRETLGLRQSPSQEIGLDPAALLGRVGEIAMAPLTAYLDTMFEQEQYREEQLPYELRNERKVPKKRHRPKL